MQKIKQSYSKMNQIKKRDRIFNEMKALCNIFKENIKYLEIEIVFSSR